MLSLICPFWSSDVLLSLISLLVTFSLLVSLSVCSSLLCHSISSFYLICHLPLSLILIYFLFPALCFPFFLMAFSGDVGFLVVFLLNVLLAPSVWKLNYRQWCVIGGVWSSPLTQRLGCFCWWKYWYRVCLFFKYSEKEIWLVSGTKLILSRVNATSMMEDEGVWSTPLACFCWGFLYCTII